jgi:hypothetical protein
MSLTTAVSGSNPGSEPVIRDLRNPVGFVSSRLISRYTTAAPPAPRARRYAVSNRCAAREFEPYRQNEYATAITSQAGGRNRRGPQDPADRRSHPHLCRQGGQRAGASLLRTAIEAGERTGRIRSANGAGRRRRRRGALDRGPPEVVPGPEKRCYPTRRADHCEQFDSAKSHLGSGNRRGGGVIPKRLAGRVRGE